MKNMILGFAFLYAATIPAQAQQVLSLTANLDHSSPQTKDNDLSLDCNVTFASGETGKAKIRGPFSSLNDWGNNHNTFVHLTTVTNSGIITIAYDLASKKNINLIPTQNAYSYIYDFNGMCVQDQANCGVATCSPASGPATSSGFASSSNADDSINFTQPSSKTGAHRKVIEINSEAELQKWMDQSDYPVIVDFYATWCGPCRTMSPIMDNIAQEYGDRIVFLRVDADKHISGNYEVASAIPEIHAYFKGKDKGYFLGVRDPSEVKDFIRSNLKIK